MKITFIGTGAADWPLIRPEEYTEFRRLSSTLVDDCLLIDPGPQVIDGLKELGKDLQQIKYVINTHNHSDHYNAETLAALEACGAKWIPMEAGQVQTLGRYTVRAYRANHSTVHNAVHFIISDGERTLFYGLDGAWLLYEEVQAIKEYRPDLAILDATIGEKEGDYRIFEHNNLRMVREIQTSLKPYIKQFCIDHMARTLHTDHQSLEENMKAYGIMVAYDGLEVEI